MYTVYCTVHCTGHEIECLRKNVKKIPTGKCREAVVKHIRDIQVRSNTPSPAFKYCTCVQVSGSLALSISAFNSDVQSVVVVILYTRKKYTYLYIYRTLCKCKTVALLNLNFIFKFFFLLREALQYFVRSGFYFVIHTIILASRAMQLITLPVVLAFSRSLTLSSLPLSLPLSPFSLLLVQEDLLLDRLLYRHCRQLIRTHCAVFARQSGALCFAPHAFDGLEVTSQRGI